MKFTLEIELGNEGMQSPRQLEIAIKEVSSRVFNRQPANYQITPDAGNVFDVYGNTVGKWEVKG